MISYSVKLKANLSRIQKNGNAALYLLIIINRKSHQIPMGLSWPVQYVDNKSGLILPRGKKDKDYNDYHLIIQNQMEKVSEIFKLYRIQDKPLDLETFLYELKNTDRTKDFIVYMELKLKERLKHKEISNKTYIAGMGTVKRLKLFKGKIPFYTINKNLLQSFSNWLQKKYDNDRGTIWGRIKDFKTYIHLAESEEINVPRDYTKYVNRTSSSALIYLEDDELDRLMKLYNSKKLKDCDNSVLRAFLFSCFTSLRISDVQLSCWDWMSIDKVLTFVPKKNKRFNRQVQVPLSPIAYALIERKRGLFFNLPTDQEVNRTLKMIASEDFANISKVLTFHVARHTFGTHYYRQTKDIVTLQKIMGHSKITTTMVYVHINEDDKRKGVETMSKFFVQTPSYLRVVS